MLLLGDCREVLRDRPDNQFHAVVTDPPYHLARRGRGDKGFMDRPWDGGQVAFQPATWAELLRVARPGAYLTAFGGTRTFHRLACAVEDAGWEIRDTLMWVYGSGFPKGTDRNKLPEGWEGWNTALKPAWEPIILARKPLDCTVRSNVERWGCGLLNIDGCRIPTDEDLDGGAYSEGGRRAESSAISRTGMGRVGARAAGNFVQPPGRFPANLVHDGSDEVVACFPLTEGQRGTVTGNEPSAPFRHVHNPTMGRSPAATMRGDLGSAARCFYCAKARGDERGDGNDHPTVKPLELMRWLVRLVTPRGGVVLDPFTGSGTTWLAADAEGKGFLGVELEQAHVDIVLRRRTAFQGGLEL